MEEMKADRLFVLDALSSQHVRAAVLGVLRDARDAPDEPFEGETGMALVLHAWAFILERELRPCGFVAVAYGPAGARYEELRVDVFEASTVPPRGLSAAVDAVLSGSEAMAGALVATPWNDPQSAAEAVLVHIGAGGDRWSQLLVTDARSVARGCTAVVELEEGALRAVDGEPSRELPRAFVEVLGGWPWGR